MCLKEKMKSEVIILCAGKGTRLNNQVPKALTPIGDMTSVTRITNSFYNIVEKFIYVVSKDNETLIRNEILKNFCKINASFPVQNNQKGILDAVKIGSGLLTNKLTWLIWCDQPLYPTNFLKELKVKLISNNFDLIMPIFEKKEQYIGLNIHDGEIISIKEQREGDEIKMKLPQDGGLFLFKSDLLKHLLKNEKKIEPGKKTNEKNFLHLLTKRIKPDWARYHFFNSGDILYSKSFNNQDELNEIKSLF